MDISSLTKDLEYKENGPAIKVLFENEASKEIRILMRKGQHMKEHKTAFPIVVEMFEGKLEFGVNGEVLSLVKGDLIALEGSVPHDLTASEDCIIRLSLSKKDDAQRVFNLVK